jgi:hypothetical protein
MNKQPYNFTPFQRLWIDALKSGRFRQGKSRLHTVNRLNKTAVYCCLGLACKLANETGELKLPKTIEEPHGALPFIKYDIDGHTLPNSARTLLKLRNCVGKFKKAATVQGDKFGSLADMNDRELTFKQIGEYIEANPENVFVS